MYIERVVLNNIKGFDVADLNFSGDDTVNHSGWAVITGDNGSGKTALLKSICMAILGPDDVRVLLPDLRGWITEGSDIGTVSVEIRPAKEYDCTARGGNPVQATFWAEIGFKSGPDADSLSLEPVDVLRKKRSSRGASNGPWSRGTQGWFALGYGPFRRLYGSSPDAQRLMVIPGRIPRFATLFKEDATLGEGEAWVRQLNYRRLEDRQSEQVALDGLLKLLNDDFLRQGVTVDKVDSEGIWLHDSAGRKMRLSDMSEGYRSALAMLIDMFRHMVDIYGASSDLIAQYEDGSFYVDRPGLVLIDEIDSHLHPEWQRQIGFWLVKHFPRVQFIVTTHSPLVCQAADHGRVYHFPSPGSGEKPFKVSDEQFARIIAGKPDQILLSPAFGMTHTRSPKAVKMNERHSRLRAKQLGGGLSKEEEKEFVQLSLFAEL